MIIMISGVNGFLGKAFLSFLKNNINDVEIVGVTRRRSSVLAIKTIEDDFSDSERLSNQLKVIKPDLFFHFAGGRYNDDQLTYLANVDATRILLESLRKANLLNCRVIIPGSAAEYGNLSNSLLSEEVLTRPLSWYGLVKNMQTLLALYAATYGQSIIVARMFNVLGYGTPSTLAMGMFAKQIVEIEKGAKAIIKTKNLDGQRDFLDVNDVCHGLWLLSQHGQSGEIYNVCSQHAVTIRDLLIQMMSYSTIKGIQVLEDKSQDSASFNVIGSNAKLVRLTGWLPKVELSQSLNETLLSYRHTQS